MEKDSSSLGKSPQPPFAKGGARGDLSCGDFLDAEIALAQDYLFRSFPIVCRFWIPACAGMTNFYETIRIGEIENANNFEAKIGY